MPSGGQAPHVGGAAPQQPPYLHDVQPKWFPFITAHTDDKHSEWLFFQMLRSCACNDEFTHVRHSLQLDVVFQYIV